MNRSRKAGKKDRKHRTDVDQPKIKAGTQRTSETIAQKLLSNNIFEAVASNDEISTKDFVENKRIPLTALNSEKQTAAHVAAQNGYLNLLKYLLQQDASVLNLIDHYGNNVLFWAVQNGFLKIVEYLIDVYEVNISEKNKRLLGNCAIHVAAEHGQLEVLKYFLEEKYGDVNIQNELGESPIFVAADKTQLHIIKYLVEDKVANVTMTDINDDNVLYVCAKTGDLAIPKYLLDEKKIELNINHRNIFGCTVTFMAARFDNLELVKYFVEEKHADINIADENGKTPLHEVASIGYFEAVKYLVEQGADLKLKDKSCKTVFQTTTDKDIRKYLKVMEAKRTRRNVFAEVNDNRLTSAFLPRVANDYLNSDKLASPSDSASFRLDILLVVANACVTFFTKFCREQKESAFSQSPREADVLAVNAANTFLMTSKRIKNKHKDI